MNRDGPAGRILAVVGTRPEVIKMAPVLSALGASDSSLEVRLALTGQHDELVQDALATFGLSPDWDLGIMREGQSLSGIGEQCLAGVDGILREWLPDLLLVQGDTSSVFFSALSGYFHKVPIGHVEAGLRTGDLMRPYPEEGFRRMVDVLADLHFAPTQGARNNLLAEGISEDRIHVTGNTVVDALMEVSARGEPPRSALLRRLVSGEGTPFVLLTAHRRESFGAPLESVFEAVRRLVQEEEALEVLYPVHPNPEVTGPARRILGGVERVHLVPPLGYSDLVAALAAARLVLTDSGGLQEEAPTFGTPVLVLRELTERREGIDAGDARKVGTNPEKIVAAARAFINEGPSMRRSPSKNPYGDGRAGVRIADLVRTFVQLEVRCAPGPAE